MKLIISSVQNMVDLLKKYPAAKAIPPFQPFVNLLARLTQKEGCGCDKTKVLQEYRPLLEASLNQLTTQHKLDIKKILNCEQVCYYKGNTSGGLELACF